MSANDWWNSYRYPIGLKATSRFVVTPGSNICFPLEVHGIRKFYIFEMRVHQPSTLKVHRPTLKSISWRLAISRLWRPTVKRTSRPLLFGVPRTYEDLCWDHYWMCSLYLGLPPTAELSLRSCTKWCKSPPVLCPWQSGIYTVVTAIRSPEWQFVISWLLQLAVVRIYRPSVWYTYLPKVRSVGLQNAAARLVTVLV